MSNYTFAGLFIISLMMILAGLGTGNSDSSDAYIANFPPTISYQNWRSNPPQKIKQPDFGASITDPDTGYKIWRLGGSAAEMQRALPYPDGEDAITPQHKQHFYSRIVATNKDETYVLGSGGHKGGYAAMWRITDKRLVKWVPMGVPHTHDGALEHFALRALIWDQNFSNVYWYTDGNRLMRASIDFQNNYAVDTEVWDSFPGYDYISISLGEGEFSDDGSRVVLVGSVIKLDKNKQRLASNEDIIAYEVNTKRRVGIRTVAPYEETMLNWAGVDPTGEYVAFDQPAKIPKLGGIWTWVVPFDDINAEPRLVYTHKKHSDFVVDKESVSWLVYGNYQGVFAARLDQTFIKRIWPVYDSSPTDDPGKSDYAERPFENANGHISRVAGFPGTVLLSRNEHAGFYFVNINDPGKTRHVGNARNGGVDKHGQTVGDKRYYREPRASAADSGRYVFFVTDYKYDGSIHDKNTPYANKSYLNMIDLGG